VARKQREKENVCTNRLTFFLFLLSGLQPIGW
jgi:hypothetical protein